MSKEEAMDELMETKRLAAAVRAHLQALETDAHRFHLRGRRYLLPIWVCSRLRHPAWAHR